jgi:hypothetical protein
MSERLTQNNYQKVFKELYPIKIKVIRYPLVEIYLMIFFGIFLFIAAMQLILIFIFLFDALKNAIEYYWLLVILILLGLWICYMYFVNKLRQLILPKLLMNSYLDERGIKIDTTNYTGFIEYSNIKNVLFLGDNYNIKDLSKLTRMKNSINITLKKSQPFRGREGEIERLSVIKLEIKDAERITNFIRAKINVPV